MNAAKEYSGDSRRRVYGFGDFTLDLDAGLLRRHAEEVALRAKSFQVLAYLAQHPGRLVTKAELIGAVWPDAAVTENSLSQCLADIRRALNDDSQQVIRTLARRGYIFSAAIAPAALEFPHAPAEPPPESAHLPLLVGAAVRKRFPPRAIAGAILLLAVVGAALVATLSRRTLTNHVIYTQITNFTDSAVAPALSPDGRMVAFLRSETFFSSPDQIYIKMLPDGEPVQLTHDPRNKYAPAFSPDGTHVAYSLRTADTRDGFATYIVSALGGEPRLLLPNASGLTWIDRGRLLFSEVKTGMHMGIVTATEARSESRDVYWPEDERGMAHFSYPSPDRKWALLVEMNPEWLPCRLVPLDGSSRGRRVGPAGACTSAGWSPDGKWMYFGAEVQGSHHLWRARFPDGEPEQITWGPSEEDGVAVAPDGRSLITSVGMHQSELWLHDSRGEHRISSEGFVVDFAVDRGEWFGCTPRFSTDGRSVYYLLRHELPESPRALWRADIESGKRTVMLPGISIQEFDISRDGKDVVYSTKSAGGKLQIWVGPLDRTAPPALILPSVGTTASPRFAANGDVLFRDNESGANYLFRMKRDGSGRAKLVPAPISTIQRISPDRRWILAMVPKPGGEGRSASTAIPAGGGDPRPVCYDFCRAAWSPDGGYLYFSLRRQSQRDAGKTVAIPIPPGEALPGLPDSGIRSVSDATALPGALVIDRADIIPGLNPDTYVYVKRSVHRNLFRIHLP